MIAENAPFSAQYFLDPSISDSRGMQPRKSISLRRSPREVATRLCLRHDTTGDSKYLGMAAANSN
ncbi:predicted protein [Botrytis cinerea T4]|uniref:Uncharacterized protein n=1 Tax=Botryotinia fuckeliana (strain T4) TaxID=999810 RepID=G2YY01_BOTF4|nr:predicted protein [Botrytis cinerea T4]